jgi:N-acetylmuramoyl-L-alanine amidase
MARHLICGAVVAATLPMFAASAGATVTRESASSGALKGGHAIDPSYFVAGACESFKPTDHDRHKTVFLDAGHGGLDPGGVGVTETGQTIYEADETLPVELDAMALLRADGFGVVVSRTRASIVAKPQPGDISGGLFTIQGDHRNVAARDICANMAKANILIGIYFDAGATEQNAGSVTGYDTARPFAAQNLRLATLVQNDVLAAMNAQGWGIPNEGVQNDASLGGPALSDAAAGYGHLLLLGPADPGYFTTPSLMPGALIEPLFITDPFEGSIAASTTGQQTIARGLATAVEQYFGPLSRSKAARTSATRTKHATK